LHMKADLWVLAAINLLVKFLWDPSIGYTASNRRTLHSLPVHVITIMRERKVAWIACWISHSLRICNSSYKLHDSAQNLLRSN
jgi:hypothetical protein